MAQPGLTVSPIEDDVDVLACFDLMRVLRPHLTDAKTMAAQIGRQRGAGYQLLAAQYGGQIVGLVGYRLQENLVHGLFAYVDDLVVAAADRKAGVAKLLLETVSQEGLAKGCSLLVLDTALTNTRAQRFYFNAGLAPIAFNFARTLGDIRASTSTTNEL